MLPEDSEERALFDSRVHEAARWCAPRALIDDPAGSLRTNLLKPSLVILEDQNQGRWNFDVGGPVSEITELCRKRAEMIGAGPLVSDRFELVPSGRLLMFYPYESLCDGAARQSSGGFFDKWNIPPWDTWVWYTRLPDDGEVLYSWIPSLLKLHQKVYL